MSIYDLITTKMHRFIKAAKNGDISKVKEFIEKGIDINESGIFQRV
jgi:hypothetical protein